MFKSFEIYHILLAILVIGFITSFTLKISAILTAILFAFIVLAINIITKKITAYYYDCDIENKIWHFQRYGLYERSFFRRPIPIGFILPILLSIFSLGAVKWLAILEYEAKPAKYRVAKRHGLYRYSELTESHEAIIATWGFVATLALALISYLINLPDLAKLSVYYAAFNILPIGKLDGNRLFFGSIVTWFILAIITGLFLVYALFLI